MLTALALAGVIQSDPRQVNQVFSPANLPEPDSKTSFLLSELNHEAV
jgi:hypothetical protein